MLIEVSLKTFKYEVSIWSDQEVEVVAALVVVLMIKSIAVAIPPTTIPMEIGTPKTNKYHGMVIAWVSPHKAKR